MSALPKHTMTADEFLVWSQTQPKEAGRFELWDGQVVVKHGPAGDMNSERSQHWETKFSLAIALREALQRAKLDAQVVLDGATVRLPNDRLVEPDALVYLGPKVPRDTLIVPNPIIVCEVLSPATAKYDLSTKLDGYTDLASIKHYLICDPDKPLLIHHARAHGDTLQTRIITDPQDRLVLDPPGLTVDLTEVLAP